MFLAASEWTVGDHTGGVAAECLIDAFQILVLLNNIATAVRLQSTARLPESKPFWIKSDLLLCKVAVNVLTGMPFPQGTLGSALCVAFGAGCVARDLLKQKSQHLHQATVF